MPSESNTYSQDNCLFAYQLYWKLWVDWRFKVYDLSWIERLPELVEQDGVRLREHRFSKPGVSEFRTSSKPELAPMKMVECIRSRLQNLVRDQIPRALNRDFRLRSLGPLTRRAIEDYVATELEFDSQTDEETQAGLKQYQIVQHDVDLSQPQRTASATYCYNLHIVLEIEQGHEEQRSDFLMGIRDMILEVGRTRRHLLSRAAILPDHIDLTLGCPLEESPAEVTLSYMNNLAVVYGRYPVFRYGAYMSTFGEDELSDPE